MARTDSTQESVKSSLTLVEGGTRMGAPAPEPEESPEPEGNRLKGWIAVLLMVILVLVTVHMDGPLYLGPTFDKQESTASLR
jgi:hypothetical protein